MKHIDFKAIIPIFVALCLVGCDSKTQPTQPSPNEPIKQQEEIPASPKPDPVLFMEEETTKEAEQQTSPTPTPQTSPSPEPQPQASPTPDPILSMEEPSPEIIEDHAQVEAIIKEAEQQATQASSPIKYNQVDIDLTAMSSEMSYATLVQITQQSNDYIGKTIRITGTISSYTNPVSNVTYYTVFNTDITACCQQGIEIILPTGNYPEDGTTVTVAGKFETYIDEVDGVQYCRLNEAEIQQ